MSNNNEIELLLKQAYFEYCNGNNEKSFKIYDKILDSDFSMIKNFRDSGVFHIDFQKLNTLDIALDKCIEKHSNDPEILIRKSIVLSILEKYDDALRYVDLSLELNPNSFLNLKNKGIILMNLKKYDDAIQFLDKALTIFPNDDEIFFCKAMCLESKNDTKSIKYYIQAFDIFSNSEQVFDFSFHFYQFFQKDILKLLNSEDLPDSFKFQLSSIVENQPKIIDFYKKYLYREPDSEGLTFFLKSLAAGKSILWVEEQIKNSDEAKSLNQHKKWKSEIIDFYKKYLYREPDSEGLTFFLKSLAAGKSILWVEEQIKNSDEVEDYRLSETF